MTIATLPQASPHPVPSGGPTAFVLTHESDPGRRDKSLSIIALSITRSLGRRGVRVVRVHPNRLEHGLASRYCDAVEVSPDLYRDEEALVTFLLGLERYAGPRVLFPASDDCADFVGRHQERLRAVFELPVARREVIDSIIDKRRQYAAAAELGIPIPETHFPAADENVERLAGRLRSYPYALKPLVSHRWRLRSAHRATGGRKAFSVRTPEELVRAWDRIRWLDSPVMIQEVVPGDDRLLVTFLSYCDSRGEPVAWCMRRKIRQFPVDFGNCMLTETFLDDAAREQSFRLLRGIGYHGLSGVEWKIDPRSGRRLLIEINARAVQTIGIGSACGVDLPYLAFLDKIGRPATPPTSFEIGVKWLWLTGDVRAAFELHRRGDLGLGEWWRSIRGRKVHAVFARDDWRPFASFATGAFEGRLRRWGRRSALRSPS